MDKKYDVTALGELLIDFTDNGKSAQGNTLFEANPGGAPCNVLAMLNKLGHSTAFTGKVGRDIFGLKLKAVLEEAGIDTAGLIVDADARTTLALSLIHILSLVRSVTVIQMCRMMPGPSISASVTVSPARTRGIQGEPFLEGPRSPAAMPPFPFSPVRFSQLMLRLFPV